MTSPRYPVYVISKSRAHLTNQAATAWHFRHDGVPFRLVVESTEADAYAAAWPDVEIAVLPFHDLGQGGIPARNWVWEDSIARGYERHWIFDDNIDSFRRLQRGMRLPINANLCLIPVENFVDRYTNVGIAGLNYRGFVTDSMQAPYFLNVHVYSMMLIRNDLPFRWRGRYNEDTDLCLQTLAHGDCTVLVNAFMGNKAPTMTVKGGNTAELYQGDGRLMMARALKRQWPHVVEIDRRWRRPQHVVNWKRFKQPLIRRTDIDWENMPAVDEYGMSLVQVADEVRSPQVAALLDDRRSSL